mmetsp:Transcript_4187/g.15793  ORF Transcript_4187/g.15793 Transcript_4187/m.15793 type:complete len:105 (+) Transcript_4187:306-620(+)
MKADICGRRKTASGLSRHRVWVSERGITRIRRAYTSMKVESQAGTRWGCGKRTRPDGGSKAHECDTRRQKARINSFEMLYICSGSTTSGRAEGVPKLGLAHTHT